MAGGRRLVLPGDVEIAADIARRDIERAADGDEHVGVILADADAALCSASEADDWTSVVPSR